MESLLAIGCVIVSNSQREWECLWESIEYVHDCL